MNEKKTTSCGLKVVRRKEPFAMISIRASVEEKRQIESVATANGATVTDVIFSALRQCGVLNA